MMNPTTPTAPTADDLQRFEHEGYFVADGVFSTEECDQILDHLESSALQVDLGRSEDGALSYRPMLHLHSEPLLRVATDARWGPIVLPIVGPAARLYWEQGVAKPPQARTVLPWHQDNGYAPTIPEQYVTCWLALDDAGPDNGGMWVLPGSHRDGTRPHHAVQGSPFRAGYDGADAGTSVEVTKGSVLVFSSLVMHRSGPNTTDRPRRAWILQYCPADAIHARTREPLDDRLLVADGGVWLTEPRRERPIDIVEILANYEKDEDR